MRHKITRRTALAQICTSTAFAGTTGKLRKHGRTPVILLRSSWQTVNIGDIAHTPGMLQLLKRYVPEAKVILWPNAVDRGVASMLENAFPGLRIIRQSPKAVPWQDDPETRSAVEEATFLLHGSGPSFVAQETMFAWQATGKPYGVFGVTYTPPADEMSGANQRLLSVLQGCSFLYTRETTSLGNLKHAGVHAPNMGFAPDATFSIEILDKQRAGQYLQESNLHPHRFIAVIPRLRYTPYHLIRKTKRTSEETKRRMEINDRYKEQDAAKLREAIIGWVRKTGYRVLLCPEMTYEIDVIDPLLYDPLPEDVKSHVVRRKTWWLPDEATSVYAQASMVLSCECHSPIMALTQGTPCFYLHEPEDGIKAQMWRDIGLGDWCLEIDSITGAELAKKLLQTYGNYDNARETARRALQYARQRDGEAMRQARPSLLGATT